MNTARTSFIVLLALSSLIAAAEPVRVTLHKKEARIDFHARDGLVASYHFAANQAKPFFWPVHAPGAVPVTRGWPVSKDNPNETTDHVHQKSAWFCHGDVIPEGLDLKTRSSDKRVKGVDFWSEAPGHGSIVCVSATLDESQAAAVRAVTRNEWRTPDGIKILDEQRVISVRDLDDAYLIVLDIDLHASVWPIVFGDTKEGSLGIRVSDELRLTNPKSVGVVTSSDGSSARAPAKDNLPMWGKRADWHDYSGTVGGKPVGIAIFDHPKNAVRAAWHTRAYGLMAANPFGRNSFPAIKGEPTRLAKDDHLKLRYGILTHRGDASAAKVKERFQEFAQRVD